AGDIRGARLQVVRPNAIAELVMTAPAREREPAMGGSAEPPQRKSQRAHLRIVVEALLVFREALALRCFARVRSARIEIAHACIRLASARVAQTGQALVPLLRRCVTLEPLFGSKAPALGSLDACAVFERAMELRERMRRARFPSGRRAEARLGEEEVLAGARPRKIEVARDPSPPALVPKGLQRQCRVRGT